MERGQEGKASRPRMLIISTILRKIKVIWLNKGTSFNSIIFWAAALVTFFSFCRSGEVTVEDETKYDAIAHLSFANVMVDNAASPSVVSLNMKYSKTDKDYAGHSFRIGAATTVAMAGLEDSAIQTLGRWKSSSYLLYIRMNPQQLVAMSSSLSKCRI